MPVTSSNASSTWADELKRFERPHSLISIAREGRLVRHGPKGAQRTQISAVDECVLTLVDIARFKRKNIAFLYPAPAGDVAVLLSAQLLIQSLVRQLPSAGLGLITADPVSAARAWEELRIASGQTRTALSAAFPCYRADPDGRSPFGPRSFKGLLLGSRCRDWPVDFLVIDHLAGLVANSSQTPSVHLFADPLDPALEAFAAGGDLVWSFARDELNPTEGSDERSQLVPFSVAQDRMEVIATGIQVAVDVVRNREAENCVRRIRDDLRTMAGLCGPSPAPAIAKGVRVAWQHFTTLLCLPCRPSSFDRFAGVPPIAARATVTFEHEIAAWARTLRGEIAEYALVLASDLGEFRGILENCSPFEVPIKAAADGETDVLCVVRTHTAGRALMFELAGDPECQSYRRLHVRGIRKLNREGCWSRAIVVGLLSKWEWNHIDSGMSKDIRLLLLGATELRIAESMIDALSSSRKRWVSKEARRPVFVELLGITPPDSDPQVRELNVCVTAVEEPPEPSDPLTRLESLGLSAPLHIEEEGGEERVAEELEGGSWAGAVDAVDVRTDCGTITLPVERSVEVRQGNAIIDCQASNLQPGMCLLLGKREGRLGLLEAMAERLQKSRPDLFAATLLVSDLRGAVRSAFRTAGISVTSLYERLRLEGFDKTYHTARAYLADAGPLAPRDLVDLKLLNKVLKLDYSDRRVHEIFAGVTRLRVFRRAAGRALASAARESSVGSADYRIDPATGLSVADLKDAILEANVVEVIRRPEPVPLSELGRLDTALHGGAGGH
jgi:hypothetical protein